MKWIAGFLVIAGIGMLAFARAGPGPPAWLGLMYALLAALYAPMAFYLNCYASRITDALQMRSEESLEKAIEAQKSFWRLAGIAALSLLALYFVIIIGVIIFSMMR